MAKFFETEVWELLVRVDSKLGGGGGTVVVLAYSDSLPLRRAPVLTGRTGWPKVASSSGAWVTMLRPGTGTRLRGQAQARRFGLAQYDIVRIALRTGQRRGQRQHEIWKKEGFVVAVRRVVVVSLIFVSHAGAARSRPEGARGKFHTSSYVRP